MVEAELNRTAAVAERIRLVGIRGPGSDILEIGQREGVLHEHLHGIFLWFRRHNGDVGLFTRFVTARMRNPGPVLNRVLTYRLNFFGELYALFQELLRV